MVDFDNIYKNYNGESIKVAIIDSGVDLEHSDMSKNIRNGYNFIDGLEINDTNGHGIQIAGIIGAEDNDIGIVGIAQKSQIYPLKILNDFGKSKVSRVLEALDWCIENKVDIINISFSINIDNYDLISKIKQVKEAGIIIVASYSNIDNTFDYPAMMYDSVIGVKLTNKRKIYTDGNVVYAFGKDGITTHNNGEYI